jgi:hypothetical protein
VNRRWEAGCVIRREVNECGLHIHYCTHGDLDCVYEFIQLCPGNSFDNLSADTTQSPSSVTTPSQCLSSTACRRGIFAELHALRCCQLGAAQGTSAHCADEEYCNSSCSKLTGSHRCVICFRPRESSPLCCSPCASLDYRCSVSCIYIIRDANKLHSCPMTASREELCDILSVFTHHCFA